jgi:hypothetical protein
MFEISDDVGYKTTITHVMPDQPIRIYRYIVVITEEDLRYYKRTEENAIYAVDSFDRIARSDLVILKREDGTKKILKDRYNVQP